MWGGIYLRFNLSSPSGASRAERGGRPFRRGERSAVGHPHPLGLDPRVEAPRATGMIPGWGVCFTEEDERSTITLRPRARDHRRQVRNRTLPINEDPSLLLFFSTEFPPFPTPPPSASRGHRARDISTTPPALPPLRPSNLASRGPMLYPIVTKSNDPSNDRSEEHGGTEPITVSEARVSSSTLISTLDLAATLLTP